MCVSIANSYFNNTIVFAGVAPDGDHLLGYQNTAINLSKFDVNAMLLPIPSQERLHSENFLDTSNAKNVLIDMRKHLFEQPYGRMLLNGTRSIKGSDSFEVFKSGNFNVISANNAENIWDAIQALPNDNQPKVTDVFSQIIEKYSKWYVNYKFILAMWSGKDSVKMDPILLKFKSSNDKTLFLPGLDGHGEVPNLNKTPVRDHYLIVGHNSLKMSRPIKWSEKLPDHIWPTLPINFQGEQLNNRENNCDWFVPISELEKNNLEFRRVAPMGDLL